MANNDSNASLWEKRNAVTLPKQGPYAERRNVLFGILTHAKKFSLLREISENTYELRSRGYLLDSYATVDLQVDFKTKKMQVAINVDKDQDNTRYYDLTDSGYAVNLDGLSTEDDEWLYLEPGVNSALRDLRRKVEHQIELSHERRRKTKVRMAISAAVIGLITFCFFGARWWIFEPQEAANRERLAYNASNHEIDGEGYQIDAHTLATVPSGMLRSIPTYGGDDKALTHPRTISLSSNTSDEWCNSIKVDIPKGSSLVVAVADDSLFIRDHYVATYTNQMLTICLVDGFVNNEASERVTANLALQVKPQVAAD